MSAQLEVIKQASTLIDQKKYLQAKKILLDFLNKSKNVKVDIKFFYTLYLVSNGLKEIQNAKKYLEKCLKINDQNHVILNNLGNIYLKEGNLFKAENLYLKSFNLKKNYLIFCGLGNPEEFEKTLIKYKFKIKEKKFFPDHYDFSNKDINEIKSLAKEKRLEIVTSEKDYLRLDNSKKKNIKFIKVDLKISNQKKFESFLNKNL